MHSGNAMAPDNPSFATAAGIAALVLEGRPLWEDEYDVDETSMQSVQLPPMSHNHHDSGSPAIGHANTFAMRTSTPGSAGSSSGNSSINSSASSTGGTLSLQSASSSSSSSLGCPNTPVSSTSSGGSGGGGARSIPKVLRDETVQHIQRLRQKLMLIRSAPGTSRDAVEQAIAVSGGGTPFSVLPMDSDDEPDDGYAFVGRPGSAASSNWPSGGGSGLLSSLQSLATNTCLNTTPRSLQRTPGLLQTVESWTVSGYVAERMPTSSSISPIQSLAGDAVVLPGGAICHIARPTIACDKAKPKKKMGPHCEEFLKKIGLIKCPLADASSTATTPRGHQRQQPSPKVPYVEVHRCNALSASCNRWLNEYHILLHLFTHSEAICIDVYLGPDHHAILLEQWTIQQCDRTNQMTMTLPALCSAIRSQLYFSQISAWTEQLKTARQHDPLIHQNPRLQPIGHGVKLDVHYRIRPVDNTASFTTKPTVHNFPDAIVTDTRCVKVSLKSLPRLDAIPTFAGVGAAVAPATIALQSPSAAASSSAAASGSSPAPAIVPSASTSMTNAAPTLALTSVLRLRDTAAPMAVGSSIASRPLQDDRPMNQRQCTETGKHQCSMGGSGFDEDGPGSDDMSGSQESPPSRSPPSTSPLENPMLAHRNRQLQKYRKRLLRRDQKKKGQQPQQQTTHTAAVLTNAVESAPSVAASGAEPSDAVTGQISINSIRPPLYSAIVVDSAAATKAASSSSGIVVAVTTSPQERASVEMKSIGTQTLQRPADDTSATITTTYPNCDLCGIEMQYVCWNCDKKLFDRWSSRPASPGLLQPLPLNTGERLMQSIQRTPSFRQLQLARQRQQMVTAASEAATGMDAASLDDDINYCDPQVMLHSQQQPRTQQQQPTPPPPSTCDSPGSSNGGGRSDLNDCRLCKRQKTAHNYMANNDASNTIGINNNNSLTCSYNNNSILRNNNTTTTAANINLMHSHASGGRLDNEEIMPYASGTAPTIGYHRRTMSESLDNTLPDSNDDVAGEALDSAAHMLSSSSKESHMLHHHAKHRQQHLMPPMSEADLKLYRRAFSEDVLACGCNDDDAFASTTSAASVPLVLGDAIATSVFKTPTPKTAIPHQLTISTTNRDLLPLEISCSPSSSMSAMSLDSSSSPQQPQPPSTHRAVPKVNLTKIFSISPHGQSDDVTAGTPRFTFDSVFAVGGTRPTTIGMVMERRPPQLDDAKESTEPPQGGRRSLECADEADTSGHSSSGGSCSTALGTVHKSNSAPSFAGAAAAASAAMAATSAQQLLSPRFLKMAAIQKRRSRHLSDRSSERSSIGSDELMSDEEFGCGLDNTYMVMLTPGRMVRGVVRKPLPKSYPFGRRALLGSIEESLLQRCFVPTFHVPGFKVLLGASGGFCPTQLTIPSSTSFYELHGQCLSTPYLCEMRMPRKGYSIPRKGTVQATLLNPLGLVVRMFVVPYDLRDMPIMHQTFMRQRVLAFDDRLVDTRDGTAATACGLSTSEQMKLLRYAIHLRFQTSRSGRLALHTDIRMVISRRTDSDTAAAHAKGVLEAPNELKVVMVTPDAPKYSPRLDML